MAEEIFLDCDEGRESNDYAGMVDEIFHEKFLFLESSYSGSEMDSDSRQFLDCDGGKESNVCVGMADVIFP